MSTRTASREAREHQLLIAAVRQMARSRPADHTLGAVLFTALSAVLYLAVFGLAGALAPELTPRTWSSTELSLGLTGGAALAWVAGLVGLGKAGLALAQPNGWKSLAGLSLFAGLLLVAGPVIVLLLAA